MVNALLLRSLPFRNPERLASLTNFFPPHDSARQFHDWRLTSAYLADTALFESLEANLGGAGEWRRARVVQVSSNFFSLVGTQPVLGRGFAPGDDVDATGWGSPGRNAAAVIGYGLWQTLFGGDPKVLGSTVRVDGVPLTVIGVAPPGFDYPGKAVLWKPAAFSPGNNGWEVIARLKAGVAGPQARQEFAAEADRLWPSRTPAQRIAYPSRMIQLGSALAGPAGNTSLVLLASVAMILLIACTNVANLQMARTADRAAEFSIRSALGAGRARLTRQLLTESVLLALASAVAGLFVAIWTISVASRVQPTPLASQSYSILDSRVLGFTIVLSILSALLFGLLPSLHTGQVRPLTSRAAASDRRSRLVRETFAAAQIGLTIVLLAGSISVTRALVNLMHIDRGFDRAALVTVNVSLEGTTHRGDGSRLAYFQEALARIRRLPFVRSASATEFLPLYATAFIGGPFEVDGRPAAESSTTIPVLPDYFRTMGGRILRGREFTDADVQAGARVAIVNRRFAAQFGTLESAVGRRIAIAGNPPRTVIGVVKGMDYMTDRKITGENSNQIFVPSHSPGGFFSTFVARVDGRAEDRLPAVRDTIQSVDPQVPVFGVKTMEQRLDDLLARPRFYRIAVLCFAAFALLLAAIGIYGIISYAVVWRSHEMGVRMALGTTAARLRLRLLRQGLITITAGAIPGIAAALLSGRLLESLIEGAKAANSPALGGVALFVASTAAVAAWAATRPVARLDIIEILRTD